MNLTEELKELADKAFTNMPKELAKGLKDAIEQIKASKLKENALKVGDEISNLTLANIYNKKISFKNLFKHDYLLITFFRGSWCPFCSLELREYEKLKNEFAKNNVDIVAISPEVQKYSSKVKEENNLSFEILSDDESKAMEEFGIDFTLTKEVKKIYAGFNIVLTKQNANQRFQMPVPATYIINKDLKILFAHIEEDYTTRFEPTKALEIAKNLP